MTTRSVRSSFGPDQTRRRQAWGAERKGLSVVTNTPRAKYPIIVTTPKSAAKYPGKRAAYDTCFESQEEKQRKMRNRHKTRSSRAKKKKVQLACSTVKPKPRKSPPVPRAGAWSVREPEGIAKFQLFYDRGDVPICVGHGAKRRVQWKVDIEKLDFHYFLPLFFEGLRDSREPYSFLAHRGVLDLLQHGGKSILPVVPQLVLPIKAALNTRDRGTICKMLKVIQALVLCEKHVGEALVPYYRQILPVFNLVLLLEKRTNLGDEIDYGQRNRTNLLDLVNETLERLEATGGEDAYINIKYMIPTFETSLA